VSVIVRDYDARVLEVCRALFHELVETHRAHYPDGEIGEAFELSDRTFVAEVEGRVVGYAGLIWHGQRAELEPIVVARSHRGTGAGDALVARVVQEARDAGAVRVFARPTARNAKAIAFFHAAGFDVLGYVQLQIDLEPRERRPGEHVAGRAFRV